MKKLCLTICLALSTTFSYAEQSYKFSELEVKMDTIAQKYRDNKPEVLKQMDNLLKSTPNATPGETSLFLTYDCSLRAKLVSTLAEERLQDLKALSVINDENYSVRAATALCEAEIARFLEHEGEYQQALLKAFIFVQHSTLPTLRYWIGLNAQADFIKLSDFNSAETALKMGLVVAEENADQARLATTHQLLAETYYASEHYNLALAHNEDAQKAIDNIDDKWYQASLYTNKAFILTKLNQLDLAISFHNKALDLTKKIRVHREVQFIYLDIAYVYMLKNDFATANAIIKDVSDYSEQYDDDFLMAQSKLFLSLAQLNDKKLANQASINFEQAVIYFQENNYPANIISAWLQRAKVAKITGDYQQSNIAYEQYLTLSKRVLFDSNITIKNLSADAYQSIRIDDKVIAETKLAKATSQKHQIEENRRYFVIGVALLTIILLIILINFSWHLWKKHQLKKAEINRQRYYDPLTQAFNRRYFDEIICKRLIDDCQANKTSYLLLIDIDHFKSFNDTYGHSAGDTVLKELVHTLKGDSRLLDSVVRMGGEEFIIILAPDENLRIDVVVERILKLVSNAQIIIEDTPKTISVSIGYLPIKKAANNEDLEELINLADKGLYLAKDSGRNRAIGIKDLQCPASYIDKILIANENKLLTLTEVIPSDLK